MKQTDGSFSAFPMDCIEGMRQHVEDNSVDLIFTDPPYGINGTKLERHYNRNPRLVVPGYMDVPAPQYAEFCRGWITGCARVLKPGGSIYIVSGHTNLHHVLNALHSTQLSQVNHLVAPYSFGVYTINKWVNSHYSILHWEKKAKGSHRRTFNPYCIFADSTDSYRDRSSILGWATPLRANKPGALKNQNSLNPEFIERFIRYSSNRGDLVLDCFAGSFSTGVAALRWGRRFVGFEINKIAYDEFAKKLLHVNEQPDPPPIKPNSIELERRINRREKWAQKRREKRLVKKNY